MFYFYIVAAIGLIPVLNNFFPLLRESYSWWLVPVLALANFLIFIILHFGFLRSQGDLIKLLKLMLLNSPWAISGDNLMFLLNYVETNCS